MRVVTGTVRNGKIEVQDLELAEGVEVAVRLPEDEPFDLTPEQEAELQTSIEEADRGNTEDVADFLARLRGA